MSNRYEFYLSNFLSCAAGISDYQFSCVIYADTEEEAKSWGVHIATLYSDKVGLPPHQLRVDRNEIERNSGVFLQPEANHGNWDNAIECRVGELPDVLGKE